MQIYSFNEIKKLDEALHQLAIYEVTKGMIVIPDTIEDAIVLKEEVIHRFNYFKKLIQSGEGTFEFIKRDVLYKNGPFVQKKLDLDDPDFLSGFLVGQEEKEEKEEKEERENEKDDREKIKNYVKELLNLIHVDFSTFFDIPEKDDPENLPKKKRKSEDIED